MALHSWSRSGVAVLAGMLVASAAAQTPEALEQRLREHPSLRALDYQAAQFREASTVAAAIPDPVVSLGVNNVPVNDPAFDRFLPSNRALGIQQSIPNGARRAANSQAAQRTAVQLQVRYRAQLSSLRGELLALLHDRQRILEQTQLAGMQLQRYDDLDKAIEAELSAGSAVVYRLAEVEVERARVRRRRLALDRELRQNAAKLRSLVVEVPEWTPPALIPEVWSGDATAFHAVAVAEATVAIADQRIAAAEAAWGPDWGVQLTYQQRDPGIDFAGDDWVSGQLTFTLPLWSEQRQKPALRQAEASRSEAMMALQFAAREAVATYQSEQAVWQTAEQSLKVLATQRLAIKDEIAAQTANYEAGRGGYAAMVDGAIALLKLDAEIAALRAQREMAIARMNALLVTP